MIKFIKPEPEPLQPIQGKTPDSKEEYWVALALYKLDIKFNYQVPMFGGNRLAGGMIVDFIIWAPDATALEVFGNYWHESQVSGFDTAKLAVQRQYFGKKTIIMWADDLIDEETTYRELRKKLT